MSQKGCTACRLPRAGPRGKMRAYAWRKLKRVGALELVILLTLLLVFYPQFGVSTSLEITAGVPEVSSVSGTAESSWSLSSDTAVETGTSTTETLTGNLYVDVPPYTAQYTVRGDAGQCREREGWGLQGLSEAICKQLLKHIAHTRTHASSLSPTCAGDPHFVPRQNRPALHRLDDPVFHDRN